MTRNRRRHFFILAGVTLLAIGGIWIWNAQHRTTTVASQGTGDSDDMGGMPGMDMSGDGSVTLTASQLRTFAITFAVADMQMLTTEVRAVGSVSVDEARMVQVAPRVTGFVERLYVNVTGQPVRRGQPLMDIYSPELLAAQEELLLAANLERSIGRGGVPGMPDSHTDLVAAAKRRFALWDIAPQQVEEVLRTGRTRRTMTIFSPASGIITERNVLQGQAIMPGQALYTITDLSRLWVEVDLRGADAAAVRVGSQATMEITGVPGRMLSGRVEYVYPTMDGDARTTRARIAVGNADQTLRPGMYATVRLSSPARRALTVPSSSVFNTGERSLLFVDVGDGRLMPQDVEIGAVRGDFTEILAGVEPGQRVVTSSQFLLDSESNLGDVMRSMIGMGGSASEMGGMDMSGAGSSGAEMKGMKMKGADMKRSTPRPPSK